MPYIVYSGTASILVQGFIVLTLASMWNLLAGYAGLVSVGPQAFVGLGAYFVRKAPPSRFLSRLRRSGT
ncbi:MAG: hypothetical protein ACLPKE_01215 [Streptosporangiaceae bacterium]